ncbi:MAG TPA: sigma-70 family RNA polymerase sigma factor, partial [Polyangiaceae bacterium]
LPDLLHDVFIAAITGIASLRDNNALKSWVTGIAVNKARRLIRRRKLQRLVQFTAPADLPDFPGSIASPEVSDALYHTYEVLEKLPTEDRICFTLRQIDGMELTAIAQVTHVSLATVKRRIARAQHRFVQLARENDTLAEWLERGTLDR